jgi:hypothetical protein
VAPLLRPAMLLDILFLSRSRHIAWLCVPCLARRNDRFLTGFFGLACSDCCFCYCSILPWVPVVIFGSAVALAVGGVWILLHSRLLLRFGGTDFFVVAVGISLHHSY